MPKEKRLITAALPYTNNVPHLGNMAGSHLPADIFARFCRLSGHETVFVGGTDDHGTPIVLAAEQVGLTPKELSDHFYQIHKDIYDWFNISYDNFSRTSKRIHHRLTKEVFQQIYDNGYIFEKEVELPYCNNCERQLSDRYIEGVCPECGNEHARGDQCEQCGQLLEPSLLKKAKCKVCGQANIEFRKVKHLYIDLKKVEKPLVKWIKQNKTWRPQVKALAQGWMKGGLKERCITRDLSWGITTPFQLYKHLKFYVWVEAPWGYVSSTKEWDSKKWKQYWQNPKTKIYNFIGKDNIPFHTILFPAMIMANGKYNLPYNVVGLQYLNYERSKFSKSKGHGIFCENLKGAGLDSDYWRFYLGFVIPETKDTEFLWQDFKERVNTELVGNFGNFINRTIKFLDANFNKTIPTPKLTTKDKVFMKKIEKQVKLVLTKYENVELRQALEEILKLSAMGNKFFQDNEPWKNPKASQNIMYISTNLSRMLVLLIQPFTPNSTKKLLKILNVKDNSLKDVDKFTLKAKHKINRPEIVFNKLEEKQIQDLKKETSRVTEYFPKKKMKKTKLEEAQMAEYVSFDDWQKLDLRIGKIKKVKDHPNADKLYVLLVDMGKGENDRQVVAGLKKHYKPEELIGKQVVIFTNLQPAKLRGVESNGMLLAADFKDKVALLQPDKKIETGAKIC